MNNPKTKYVILGLLSEGNLTGYEMKKIIDIRFSFFWNESYGQIYPQLKRLAREGLIGMEAEAAGKRKKITYSLTDPGKRELVEWLREPAEKESVRFELLLKMYFSNLVDAGIIKTQVKDFMENHVKQLKILDLFQKELESIPDDGNHRDILRIIDFGQRVYKAYIEWCGETIDYLERRDLK